MASSYGLVTIPKENGGGLVQYSWMEGVSISQAWMRQSILYMIGITGGREPTIPLATNPFFSCPTATNVVFTRVRGTGGK
jgi:hypothetical protein